MIYGQASSGAARRLAALGLVAVGVLLSGCSTYADRNAALRDDLIARDYDAALKVVDEAERGSDRLLNLLERGLVLHYADRWAESNDVFAEAEALSDDLYTKSVSQAVLSLVTNDGAIDYRAAPFEMALVPYFRALNYIYLGDRDEAIVEARKAELRLRDLADVDRAMRDEEEGDDDPAVSLEDHAFVHYLRGMLHEWGGESNDAFLAYRRAALAFTAGEDQLHIATPPWLGEDLLRTGTILGFHDELLEIQQALPNLLPSQLADPGGLGRVVIFLESGFAPQRVSAAADVPIFKGEREDDVDAWALGLRGRYVHGWRNDVEIDTWIRFALPELSDQPPAVAGARISSGTPYGHVSTVDVEDVSGRSHLYFESSMGKILLKTIARAVAKYVAKEKVEEQGRVAGLLANLLGVATEQADTRNWLTLPRSIAMARLDLPPGIHDLKVELVDDRGRVLAVESLPGVVVRQGDWTFLSRRVF